MPARTIKHKLCTAPLKYLIYLVAYLSPMLLKVYVMELPGVNVCGVYSEQLTVHSKSVHALNCRPYNVNRKLLIH